MWLAFPLYQKGDIIWIYHYEGTVTWKQCQLFLDEGHLDYVRLLAAVCFNNTKKENKIYYVSVFVCFWWFGKIWRKK